MERRPTILVIFGSTRQGRRGERVVTWLMDRLAARPEASFKLVDVRDLALPLFDAPVAPARGEIAPEAAAWAAQVDQADGFLFVTPEYNHGYPAVLKNAIDHLYHQWVHKPAALVTYGGFASGYRAAEQLRQVFVELTMVPVREQVGLSLVPGVTPGLGAETGAASGPFLERALDGLLEELLWWTRVLTPARARPCQCVIGLYGRHSWRGPRRLLAHEAREHPGHAAGGKLLHHLLHLLELSEQRVDRLHLGVAQGRLIGDLGW